MSKFRDWLADLFEFLGEQPSTDRGAAKIALLDDVISMYDNNEVSVFEDSSFKVGDKVLAEGAVTTITNIIVAYKTENGSQLSYTADELTPVKTKHIFSVEKWVTKRMNEHGARYVLETLDGIRKNLTGKTRDEINREYPGIYGCAEEDDLFVEVLATELSSLLHE